MEEYLVNYLTYIPQNNEPWNKGKILGQKRPLKLKDIWAIRVHLQLSHRVRELALFNLAIDSKLRACDRVRIKAQDVAHGQHIAKRAIILQQKTQKPVQFEITERPGSPFPTKRTFPKSLKIILK